MNFEMPKKEDLEGINMNKVTRPDQLELARQGKIRFERIEEGEKARDGIIDGEFVVHYVKGDKFYLDGKLLAIEE